jgi:hypothetical protein
MRYFFYVLMIMALCLLAIIVFFENVPKLWYNLWHRNKKIIRWDPMDYMDPTEDFYHK